MVHAKPDAQQERRAIKRRIANRESARRVRDRRLAGLNKLEDRVYVRSNRNVSCCTLVLAEDVEDRPFGETRLI